MATLQDLLSEDQGPGLRTPSLDVYGPRKGLGSTDVQGLINYFRANPEAAMSMEELRQAAAERAIQQEMELTRRASLGDQRAAANLAATKQREEIEGRPLERFTTLASSLRGLDPDVQQAFAQQFGVNVPGGGRLQRIEEETRARTRAGLAEKAAVENKRLLNKQELESFGLPEGSKVEDAVGKYPTTLQQRNTISAMGTAQVVLNKMRPLVDKLVGRYSPGKGGLAGRVAGAVRSNYALYAQTDPELKQFNRFKEGMLATFSRSVGGERGQTTEQDVDRARELLTSFTPVPDTKETALTAINELQDLVKEIEGRALEGIRPQTPGKQAPQRALDLLKARPDTKEQFKAKYGYLPPGF